MYVSNETSEQTELRLEQVVRSASIDWRGELYSFQEASASTLPAQFAEDAVAFVRDEQVWSVLRPATEHCQEVFSLFTIHFLDGVDNSGFVGWLASKFKQQLGSGVFVVCGQNSSRGGIFDHWGVPAAIASAGRELLAD